MNLILPVDYVNLSSLKRINPRVYFLAGPIMGGDDWQAKACKMLGEKDPGCVIINPCRYGVDHELYPYALQTTDNLKSEEIFPNQTKWERYYMLQAASKGCLIFWLPEESKTDPRPPEKGPYARDTYGEIGEWRYRLSQKREAERPWVPEHEVKVVFGAEPNFPGLSIINKNLQYCHGIEPNSEREQVPIYTTLEETVEMAVMMAKGGHRFAGAQI
ncbi:hypothetical protein IPM19_03915 [bacterium]|nr:MAG: hypothetical protein IPM19_03915 [bacterium]